MTDKRSTASERRARPASKDEKLFRKIKILRPAVRPDRATREAIRRAVRAFARERAV